MITNIRALSFFDSNNKDDSVKFSVSFISVTVFIHVASIEMTDYP